ncbi:DoxX family membrane protein [Candidatus Woesearchaeota archaeon]|nr:DoxX family membrane protein [Candidatus Woesearchaeota archaeon]
MQWMKRRKRKKDAVSRNKDRGGNMMDFLERNKEWGPRIIAIALGIAFVVAGLDKVLNLSMAAGMFSSLFGGQGWLVYPILLVEIFGGLALIVNWHAREAALVLAVVMVVAFVVTFKIGATTNFISAMREIIVMNTGGGNTAVNFAYFFSLVSLGFSDCKQCKK